MRSGPAYTLSVEGTAFALEIGCPVVDRDGKRLAPVDVVLETDSRNPEAKHAILEMYVQHGLVLPDTPVMALHRGRIDLLEEHLRRDPNLLKRTFVTRKFIHLKWVATTRSMQHRARPQRIDVATHVCRL